MFSRFCSWFVSSSILVHLPSHFVASQFSSVSWSVSRSLSLSLPIPSYPPFLLHLLCMALFPPFLSRLFHLLSLFLPASRPSLASLLLPQKKPLEACDAETPTCRRVALIKLSVHVKKRKRTPPPSKWKNRFQSCSSYRGQ